MSLEEKSNTEYISSLNDVSDEATTTEQEVGDSVLDDAPLKFKVLALIGALTFPIGSHFSQSALSAMKVPLKANLHIDNTQYGVISSAVSIINTVFPIAGGIFVDTFGSVWATLCISCVVIIGSLLTTIAAKYSSFGLMIAGRVVFGIGAGLIVTMQESILSKWFRTRNLSIAIGTQLSLSRLATFLGTLVANPVAQATGDWVWPFWLSFIICCLSIFMNLMYALVVRHLRKKAIAEHHARLALSKTDIKVTKRRKAFQWKSLLKFPPAFFLLLLIEFLLAAVWFSFQTISTELVEKHFGHANNVLAGYTASASVAVPIIASPILGVIMDVFGLRVSIIASSAVFLIVSCVLLNWTYVNATVGMVFYSISLAFGPIGVFTTVGMLLPSDYVGTGLGLLKAANNIGTTILDIVVGVVQDRTAHQAYTNVMILFLALTCVGLLMTMWLWFAQYYYLDNLLEASRRLRLEGMKEKNDKEVELNRRGLDSFSDTPVQKYNFLFLAFFVVCLVVAWVLFFVYAATGQISS